MRETVILSGRPLVYPLWLASPLLSGSPRWVTPLVLLPLSRFTLRSHPVMLTVFHGIALPPWMFLKSVARQLLGTVRPRHPRPCSPLGLGLSTISVRASGNSSFILPLRRPWALSFFCSGEPDEGFLCSCTSLCWSSSCLAFLCFPPHSFRLVAGVRLGPYHRVLGVRFRSSCLIACLRVRGICLSHDEVMQAVGLFP